MSDLYFILNPSLGVIKIGIAANVDKRRCSLQRACGVTLEVLAIVPGGERFERPLHEAFASARLLGEWFSPSPELLALAADPATIPAFIGEPAGWAVHYPTSVDLIVTDAAAKTAERRAMIAAQRERNAAMAGTTAIAAQAAF